MEAKKMIEEREGTIFQFCTLSEKIDEMETKLSNPSLGKKERDESISQLTTFNKKVRILEAQMKENWRREMAGEQQKELESLRAKIRVMEIKERRLEAEVQVKNDLMEKVTKSTMDYVERMRRSEVDLRSQIRQLQDAQAKSNGLETQVKALLDSLPAFGDHLTKKVTEAVGSDAKDEEIAALEEKIEVLEEAQRASARELDEKNLLIINLTGQVTNFIHTRSRSLETAEKEVEELQNELEKSKKAVGKAKKEILWLNRESSTTMNELKEKIRENEEQKKKIEELTQKMEEQAGNAGPSQPTYGNPPMWFSDDEEEEDQDEDDQLYESSSEAWDEDDVDNKHGPIWWS